MITAEFPLLHSVINFHGTMEWDRLLSDSFIPGETALLSNRPAGQLRMVKMGEDILLADVLAHPQIIIHNVRHIESAHTDARNSFIAHIILDGEGTIEQSGHILPFKTGDISFRCSQEPSKVIFSKSTRFIALRLPSHRLFILNSKSSNHPRIVAAARNLSSIVRDLSTQILTNNAVSTTSENCSVQAFLWMIAAVFHDDTGQPRDTLTLNAFRWQQIVAFLDEHLLDEKLTLSVCARSLGISERYLHKLFASRDLKFSSFVINRRLDWAKSFLGNIDLSSTSISSIAYQSGFKNAAHFSRAFHAHFGLSPRDCRAAAKIRHELHANSALDVNEENKLIRH